MAWNLLALNEDHRLWLAAHWCALSSTERINLFGRSMFDSDISITVDRIDYARTPVFAVLHPALDIIGAVHLKPVDRGLEAAISVVPLARHQGIETLLIRRAISYAREHGLRPVEFRGDGSMAGISGATAES